MLRSGTADDEIQVISTPRPRAKSADTTSSSQSGSSYDSWRQKRESGHSFSRTQDTSTRRRSNSIGRFFLGTKEPSLESFKHLAQQQQKALDKKGQKLPFGVPQAKIPDTAKEDYQKAKQRAKENAMMHQALKERFKAHEAELRQRQRRKDSVVSTAESSLLDSSQATKPVSPRQRSAWPQSNHSNRNTHRSQARPSLDTLQELPRSDGDEKEARPRRPSPSHRYSQFSARTPPEAKTLRPHITGVLTGGARKQALPWE